jgi:Rieske Fe-S protein
MSSTDRTACRDCLHASNRRTFLHQTLTQLSAAFLVPGIAVDIARDPAKDSKTYALPEADGVQIDRDSNVILVRWLDSVYAFSLDCPHQKTSLRWNEKKEHFQCPKHHSEYAADGIFIKGRATRGMDRYAIRRAEKTVVVDLQTVYKLDDDPKSWAAAVVAV